MAVHTKYLHAAITLTILEAEPSPASREPIIATEGG